MVIVSMNNIKSTAKVFALKCLFLCHIDLNHTPGPILLLLVEIIAVTFMLINSITVKPLLCGQSGTY